MTLSDQLTVLPATGIAQPEAVPSVLLEEEELRPEDMMEMGSRAAMDADLDSEDLSFLDEDEGAAQVRPRHP